MEATAPAILDLALVLLAAAAVGWLARRLGLPAVVGYLLVGLAVSPFTPGYVADRHQLQLLADVGVVLLLFEVGIEVDPGRLRREARALLWAAPLQLAISTLVATASAIVAGVPTFGALLLGLAVAMSSSVVVVNITRSRRRTTDRETDHVLLGWSVLQDVLGVAAAAVILALFEFGGRSPETALLGLGAYGVLVLIAARVLPRVLVHLRPDPDLFLIVSVASGLALAGLGAVGFGVPLALAAFVAGLAVTDHPAAAEARRRLLPFRDVFAVLFFVGLGTLIDPGALGRGLPWLALLMGLLVGGKVAVIVLLSRLAGLKAHPLQLGFGLGQLGEFSFVLASAGLTAGVVRDDQFAAVLGAVALSVAASTVLVRLVRPSGEADPPVPGAPQAIGT